MLAFVRVVPLVLLSPLGVAFLVLYLRQIARTERERRDALIAERAEEIRRFLMSTASGRRLARSAAVPPWSMTSAELVECQQRTSRALLRAAQVSAEAIQTSMRQLGVLLQQTSESFARFGAAIAEAERRRQAVDVHDSSERL